jgi:methylated-DNA-[protein]-cysteine S-methyltransferase
MQQIYIQHLDTRYGELILGSHNQQLCLCDWRYRNKRDSVDSRLKNGLKAEFIERDDSVLKETRRQLGEYFNHKRKRFDIPLLMVGTPFQKKVWNNLLEIPFGKTSSYLQLAESISNKNAVRAVASANGANAISIIIPCHRIIGSNGKLVGYAGGLRVKAELLSLEFDLFN